MIVIVKRKSIILIVIGLLLFSSLLLLVLKNDTRIVETLGIVPVVTVVIDPGHGGIDGGTHDNMGFLEKDINLEVGMLLKEYLESNDIDVIMTREEDISLEHKSKLNSSRYRKDLDARRNIINQSNADYLISIHVNANPKRPTDRGVQVFYYSKSEEGKKLAASISKSINKRIFMELLNTKEARSVILPANYFILRETTVPSCLVEIGFMTNSEDKKLLSNDDYKKNIAIAIGEAIK